MMRTMAREWILEENAIVLHFPLEFVGSATVLPYTFMCHEHTALVYAYDCDGCTTRSCVLAKVESAIIQRKFASGGYS